MTSFIHPDVSKPLAAEGYRVAPPRNQLDSFRAAGRSLALRPVRAGAAPRAARSNKNSSLNVNFSKIASLFRARCHTDDGEPVRGLWVANENRAFLIDADAGRVLAVIWHDGYGKYYPTLILPFWKAVSILRGGCAWLVSLLSFPRLSVEVYRIRAGCMAEALQEVEDILGA